MRRQDLSDDQKRALGWRRYELSEVMTPVADPVSVEADAQYPNMGILSFGRGVFNKAPIDGSRTSAKTLYRIRAGQFIYSRLFAFEGAYAAVPQEFDGRFVSNEFPTFDVDEDIADAQLSRRLLPLAADLATARALESRARRSPPARPCRGGLGTDRLVPPAAIKDEIVDQLARLSGAEGPRTRFLNLLDAFEASALNDLISLAQPA